VIFKNAGLAPIQEKAIKAINEIATSKGILYVMTSGSLLVKNGEDLYEAVKVKLGLLADVKAPVVPQK
jgi:outer membrane protein